MARIRSVGGTRITPLSGGWQLAATPPGQIAVPAELVEGRLDWCRATAPSTAASSLRSASRWSFDDRVDFDASDWWWRCDFPAEAGSVEAARVLRFGGLASIAEVWLNGTSVLKSDNMFHAHEVPVDGLLRDRNELVVCCRSVASALKARRPRPRWRTRLVETQQLRWIRTTLLGRIPAWTPAAAPVGPWRPVSLEERSRLSSVRADVRPRVEGDAGVVDVALDLDVIGGAEPETVVLRVGSASGALAWTRGDSAGRVVARGSVRIPDGSRWWPHTHGSQPRHPVEAVVSIGGQPVVVDLGAVAFRELEVSREAGGFGLRINGAEVFLRGACWTTVDAVSLGGSPEAYRSTLEAVRAAGMNMIRVCGPFFYEDDALYDACDELGIVVWQDYAFANMDYPGDDPGFVASVEREAREFLDRTQTAVSLAVLCGNSEVEQQAAMMGAPRELWRSSLFEKTLSEVSTDLRPDVPYWPSTPSGGGLPFVTDAGTAHYFGVGAYLRPLEDARRAEVRFATECLAFANVPDVAVVDELMKGGGSPTQDPRWKSRTPRDGGAGWDFEDVRDHYLRTLFDVDPAALRYSDVSRYLALSRMVTGEVMAATFSEWRRDGSSCGGALVWFLRDLWPGAGWGVLDAAGRPKAAYHYLRRTLQPTAVLLVDEGLNGLDLHVVNDGPLALDAEIRVACFRGEAVVANLTKPLPVGKRSVARLRVAELFEHFFDVTHAYRFGPPSHDVTVATLVDRSTGLVRSEAFHFPAGLPSQQEADVGLDAIAMPGATGGWKLALRTRRLAQSVELEVRGFEPEDNYFHVAPGGAREVTLHATGMAATPQGSARPLNSHATAKIAVRQ
jgi:beta-mannosidase